MSPELFEEKVAGWTEKLLKDYPIKASFPEWEITIEEKTDSRIPVVTSVSPRMRLVHRHWKGNHQGRKIFGYDVRPDRLVFRVTHEEGVLHDFSEIQAEMTRWGPLWMDHFNIPHLDGTTVEYVNEISQIRTPQFVTSDKTVLELTKALKIFSAVTGKHIRMCPPLDCHLSLMYNEQVPRTCGIRIFAVPQKSLKIQVQLNIGTKLPNKKLTLKQALDEIGDSHTVAIEQFQNLFTAEALASFE